MRTVTVINTLHKDEIRICCHGHWSTAELVDGVWRCAKCLKRIKVVA